MKQFFPFLNWLFPYKKSNLTGDLSAGLTVGIMLIPQGMAYAMLAGLPPIYGLYASTIPLLIYALFGTSRQLAVGPVAMVSLLIASGVGSLAVIGSAEYIAYAILLALMVGLIQLFMGVFKLGFMVNFLAHPVIAGFTSAAAIIIGFSQMKHLLGINIPRGKVHQTIGHIFQEFNAINYPTLLLGVSAIGLLVLLKKINKRLPGPLIVVLLGLFLVYFLGLHNKGVNIIKEIPSGLSSFALPEINGASLYTLLPIALTISFVSFIESIAVSKAIERKHKNYKVRANQELVALGLSNIAGSFFQSFPVTGGFSRTAVNDQSGAKTGLASIISASVVLLSLLLFTKYFYYLPTAILAAIIFVAVFGLIDFKGAQYLWHHDKRDFWIFMATAFATLGIGIEEGILTGVVLSIGILVYNASSPHIAELGQVPNSWEYRNVKRFDNLQEYEDVLIFRFDAQLFFANTYAFKNFIESKIAHNNQIKHIIVEASVINNLDSSATHMLSDLIEELKVKKIQLYFTDVKGPVRDRLKQTGILCQNNLNSFYLSTKDAVEAIKNKKIQNHKDFILQTSN